MKISTLKKKLLEQGKHTNISLIAQKESSMETAINEIFSFTAQLGY